MNIIFLVSTLLMSVLGINAMDSGSNTLKIVTLTDQLVEAVKANDSQTVGKLMKTGVDINGHDKNGISPLMWSAWHGYAEICNMLINQKADINYIHYNGGIGRSAIIWAAMQGHPGVAKILIENRLTIDQLNVGLRVAAGNGEIPICKDLIEAKANVNSVNSIIGTSPLWYAAINAHPGVCALLISANTDAVNITNVLHEMICRHGRNKSKKITKVCKLLIEKEADLNSCDELGLTALVHATACNDYEICTMLLQANADVNQRDRFNSTPLMEAIRGGKDTITQLFLNSQAKVNCINYYRQSALDIAYETRNHKGAMILIYNGAQFRHKQHLEKYTYSLLKEAANVGGPELTNALAQGIISKMHPSQEKTIIIFLHLFGKKIHKDIVQVFKIPFQDAVRKANMPKLCKEIESWENEKTKKLFLQKYYVPEDEIISRPETTSNRCFIQ